MTINWAPKRQDGRINWAPKAGNEGALQFVTTDVPRAFVGVAYFAQIEATAASTFAITSGTLPPGLTLSPSGAVSGTPTGAIGTSSVVITATSGDNSATTTLTFEVVAAPTVQSVVLAPTTGALRVGETVDLQATVLDQYGQPIKDMLGVALAAPGSVATAAMIGLTDAAGKALVRVTAVSAGAVSIVAKFGDFISEPSIITVTVPVVALLGGAAKVSAVTVANLSVAVVKGAQIRLYNRAGVPRASIPDVQVRWWDGDSDTLVYRGVGAIDSGGWIKVNLDAATALPVGGVGRIDLYKQGASIKEDWHFASRLAVVDLRVAQ